MELLDTDSDEELPSGWEERVTTDGRVYYAKYVFQCKSSIIAQASTRTRFSKCFALVVFTQSNLCQMFLQ